MSIRYCVQCLLPETKPDLLFSSSGVCNACSAFESRDLSVYESRRAQLSDIIEKHRSKNSSNYDCVVPVSGGKDSTYQVLKVLELGLNPLCVTSTTCDQSELGTKNIENLKRLGVDHIQISPNPKIRRKLNRIGLLQVGDISWPEHVGIFTIPIQVAVRYNIPLIVWGENSQHEYGGPAASQNSANLDRRWLEEFGGLLGLRVGDIVGMDGITEKDLLLYRYPSDEELKRVGVTGFFLGYFFPWDGLGNAMIAQAHGFHSYETHVEGSMVNYENLDNYQTGIHDYFKYLKFGFSRATDIASLHIRRKRISREEALEIVKRNDGQFPWKYMGKALEEILDPIEMSIDEFIQVCDRFTNKKLFKTDSSGRLIKDRRGNLTKINYDNV